MDVIDDCKTNAFAIRGLKANYIIDSGFGSQTSKILTKFINPNLETIIINTHFHWDHIWGNAYFDNKQIIQHTKCPHYIDLYWEEMYLKYSNYQCGDITKEYADKVFDSDLNINDEILLFHSPGHTDDCISAYFIKDKALFVGDNFGDNDTDIIPVLECENSIFLSSLRSYNEMKPNLILSGHNDVRGIDLLNKMISEIERNTVDEKMV